MDIIKLIERSRNVLGEEYVNAFLHRKAGSTWNILQNLEDVNSLNWEEIEVDSRVFVNGCQYFQAVLDKKLFRKIKARVNIVDFANLKARGFEKEEIVNDVEEYVGSHGRELYCSGLLAPSDDDEVKYPRVASLILGEHKGECVIYSMFPGTFTASIKSPILKDKSRKELVNLAWEGFPIAVKVVDNKIASQRIEEKINIIIKYLEAFEFSNLIPLLEYMENQEQGISDVYPKGLKQGVYDVLLKDIPVWVKQTQSLRFDVFASRISSAIFLNPSFKKIKDFRNSRHLTWALLDAIGVRQRTAEESAVYYRSIFSSSDD